MGTVLDEIEDAMPLYLGMLLHDIGKGRGGGHVEKGTRIAIRTLVHLGLDPESAAKVLFLIEAHLEMSQLSQQRDLSEPAPDRGLREALREPRAAQPPLPPDLRGPPGGGAGDLDRVEGGAALGALRSDAPPADGRGRPTTTVPTPSARRRSSVLREEFPVEKVEHHFAMLPERYLRSTDGEHMCRDFRLLCSRGEQRVGGRRLARPGAGAGQPSSP